MSKLAPPFGCATTGRWIPPMSFASSGTVSAAKPKSVATSTYYSSRSAAPCIPSSRL